MSCQVFLGFRLFLYFWTWGCTLIQAQVRYWERYFSLCFLSPPRNLLLTFVHEHWSRADKLPLLKICLSPGLNIRLFFLFSGIYTHLFVVPKLSHAHFHALLSTFALVCYDFPLPLARYMSRLHLWKALRKIDGGEQQLFSWKESLISSNTWVQTVKTECDKRRSRLVKLAGRKLLPTFSACCICALYILILKV